MELAHSRLRREHRTLAAMLAIYCHDHHSTQAGLCAECNALLDYAGVRLQRCCFQEQKPTCVRCPVHCYRPRERESVRQVMRYAGPRMLWRHPVLAIRHLMDGWFGPRPDRAPGPQTTAHP